MVKKLCTVILMVSVHTRLGLKSLKCTVCEKCIKRLIFVIRIPNTSIKQGIKIFQTLTKLCSRACQFESCLVGNPEKDFSLTWLNHEQVCTTYAYT